MVLKQIHESKVQLEMERARIIHKQDEDRMLLDVIITLGKDHQLTPSRYFKIMETISSARGYLDEQKSIKHLPSKRFGI